MNKTVLLLSACLVASIIPANARLRRKASLANARLSRAFLLEDMARL